jgi:hypothetical protein
MADMDSAATPALFGMIGGEAVLRVTTTARTARILLSRLAAIEWERRPPPIDPGLWPVNADLRMISPMSRLPGAIQPVHAYWMGASIHERKGGFGGETWRSIVLRRRFNKRERPCR